ncbi:MAG TPA: response regulator transcription factor [Candidatus Eremiobacteraceae bacterium]
MTRVFIAADTLQARETLEAVVVSTHDFELAGSSEIEQAIKRFQSLRPLVAVVDAPDLESAYQAIETRAQVVVLGDAALEQTSELLRAGAAAVLPRDADSLAIVAAVRAAAAGLVSVMREAAPALASTSSARSWPIDEDASPHLSPREREVLRLVAAGTGNKGIALRLGISEHTVKFHVASILAKLHAGSRTEAVTEGIRRGLVML